MRSRRFLVAAHSCNLLQSARLPISLVKLRQATALDAAGGLATAAAVAARRGLEMHDDARLGSGLQGLAALARCFLPSARLKPRQRFRAMLVMKAVSLYCCGSAQSLHFHTCN